MNYRQSQLDRIQDETDNPAPVAVKFMGEKCDTKWMSMSLEDFNEVKALMILQEDRRTASDPQPNWTPKVLDDMPLPQLPAEGFTHQQLTLYSFSAYKSDEYLAYIMQTSVENVAALRAVKSTGATVTASDADLEE